jgi:pimeloyl-ACP methyl ester carboxylesterase
MTKVEFKNAKGLRIVGNYGSIGSDKIVILAHGFTNDKSSNGRFDALILALNHSGYDALAIDFSGSGESDDAALTKDNQKEDLKASIDYVQSKGYEKVALLGNSFGTLACLNNYDDTISTMVLIGALMDKMHYNWHEYFTGKQMNDLERKGHFYTEEYGRKHKMTQQTLLDFEEIDQEKLLIGVNCPVLIIHGNHTDDFEELKLLENSKRAMHYLPEMSELRIIDNGKHGFRSKWKAVIDLTINWLQRYF